MKGLYCLALLSCVCLSPANSIENRNPLDGVQNHVVSGIEGTIRRDVPHKQMGAPKDVFRNKEISDLREALPLLSRLGEEPFDPRSPVRPTTMENTVSGRSAEPAQQLPQPPKPGSSRWGKDDLRGGANLITPEKVLEAVRLIKTGKVYQLGSVYEEGMPLRPHRHFSVIMPFVGNPTGKNMLSGTEELLISEIGQVGTQLDGLGHVGVGDIYYNGHNRLDFQTAKGLTLLGIENAGVFITRGILLDIARLKGVRRLELGYEITVNDITQAMEREKVQIRPGDAVLFHTGWGSLWKVDNDLYNRGEPGIGMEAANFLADQNICLVGADTWATEVVPNPNPDLAYPAHQILIPLHGIYNLEIVDTRELAQDQVYEFAFFLAPLRLKGFTGSPGNPVAIR